MACNLRTSIILKDICFEVSCEKDTGVIRTLSSEMALDSLRDDLVDSLIRKIIGTRHIPLLFYHVC